MEEKNIQAETSTEPVKKDKAELMRAIKFTLFSISAGVIQILTTEVILQFLTDWAYPTRYLIGLVLSVIWNFTFNRKFTFHSANNVPIAMLKVLGYYIVFTPLSTILTAFLVGETDFAILESFTQNSPQWNELIVQVLVMVINFVTEFIFDRFVVFGKSIDTNVDKNQQ